MQVDIETDVTVDDQSDTPVVPAENFNHVIVGFVGTGSLRLSMTPGSTKYVSIASGSERLIATPRRSDISGFPRFPVGLPAFYLRCSPGGSGVATWLLTT